MGLRPRFKTPFAQARDKLVGYAIRPFAGFDSRTRFFIGYGVLVLATTLLLISNYSSGFTENYKEGDVVARTIIAPADITTVDISEKENDVPQPGKQLARYSISTPVAQKAPCRVFARAGTT